MFRTTLAVAAATILAAPAAAQSSLGQLLQYTGQIRGQMAQVRAQTDATFSCPRGQLIADDVYDELEDLCRELDRLEEQIARPMVSRHQLARLERALHRVDDQACAVEEAVHAALADPRRLASQQVAYLPQQGFQTQQGFLPQQGPIGYPGITTHTVGHRGVRVIVGGGRFNLSIGGQPNVFPAATPHYAARPVVVGRPTGDPQGAALCAQTKTLRLMTQQLLALVCH